MWVVIHWFMHLFFHSINVCWAATYVQPLAQDWGYSIVWARRGPTLLRSYVHRRAESGRSKKKMPRAKFSKPHDQPWMTSGPDCLRHVSNSRLIPLSYLRCTEGWMAVVRRGRAICGLQLSGVLERPPQKQYHHGEFIMIQAGLTG